MPRFRTPESSEAQESSGHAVQENLKFLLSRFSPDQNKISRLCFAHFFFHTSDSTVQSVLTKDREHMVSRDQLTHFAYRPFWANKGNKGKLRLS